MKKTATTSFLALAISVWILGHAGPAWPAGINLSWDDCGNAGSQIKQFACDTNTGLPFELIGSFDPPAGIEEFVGISATIGFQFTLQSAVPDWWAMSTGECRSGSLVADFNFVSGPFTCTDPYSGQGAGGFSYEHPVGNPNRARLRIQAAIPIDNRFPLDQGTEYYAFRVQITRAKTTGAGSCSGCDASGVCITLEDLQIFQPPEQANDPFITNPIERNITSWQSLGPACPPCPCPVTRMSMGELKCRFR